MLNKKQNHNRTSKTKIDLSFAIALARDLLERLQTAINGLSIETCFREFVDYGNT